MVGEPDASADGYVDQRLKTWSAMASGVRNRPDPAGQETGTGPARSFPKAPRAGPQQGGIRS